MRSLLSFVWTLIIVVSTSAAMAPALAQQADREAIIKRYQDFIASGNYPAALGEAQKFGALIKPNDSMNAFPLVLSAYVYTAQGRYADAEPLYKRALAIVEKARGPDHPDVATPLTGLAHLNSLQGRYADAESLYKRALAIVEKDRGRDHREVANALNGLAEVYHSQGRYADAEPLLKRSLTIAEKALGPDHLDVATSLNNLARNYIDPGRYADAEPLLKRSLAIMVNARGPDHPNIAHPLNGLAWLYIDQGRYADAEPLLKRALAISENALGPDHPAVAMSLDNLAHRYSVQGRYADAEPLIKRALAILEKALGRDHPDVAKSLNNLARNYSDQGSYAEALPLVQTTIAHGGAYPFVAVPVLFGAQGHGLISAAQALDDALNVVQEASQSSAAAAVSNLAVRLAAGSDRLAQLVRKDQDLAAEAQTLDKRILAAVSKEPAKRDGVAEQRTRDRLAAVATERQALRTVFAAEFPDYTALSDPWPLTVKDIQGLLSDNEALVLWSAGDKQSYVFALTHDNSAWKTIPLGAQTLSEKVAAFRHGLDVEALGRGLERVECAQAEADRRGLSRIECSEAITAECAQASANDRGMGRIECRRELFDLAVAHELYITLLGPVEALVKGKRDLLVVPSGALTALPFHLLVTEKPVVAVPASRNPKDLAIYRDAAWLLKRQTITVMPSVSSLKALRVFARKYRATKPMVGFGDPIFDPDELKAPVEQRTANRTATQTRGYGEFWQGVAGDRAKLSSLPRLPDTADELKAIAANLGAAASDIHLRAEASVTTVKRTPLADYRIVYFATHGLVAGDVKGLAEPSLALTIPAQPSDFDHGLLTASDVAQLKLNADWAVLSACNTIAGDKPGAEALSGLARAFFYAGARALLVSHWSVDTNAATRLTISTFDYLKADPTIGRAEALRRAMLAYMSDASDPRNAYPAFWAPFEIVGEGGMVLAGQVVTLPVPEAAKLPISQMAPAVGEAERAWAATRDTPSPAVLEAFIKRFADSFYADLARERLEALKASTKPAGAKEARLTDPADPLRLGLVTDCDRLAALPSDSGRAIGVVGIALDKIDIAPALAACNEAMRQYPNVARFAYQAGRVASAQKDYAGARKLFESAVAMGSSIGMTAVGSLYANGWGVPLDYAEARGWFEKAAAAGERNAIYNLGSLYAYGRGVPRDYADARRWFEKAAAAGMEEAKTALKQLGSGKPR
jgi:CHAT domain-containing protein/tetratricopeptide (TPR) repeat protein